MRLFPGHAPQPESRAQLLRALVVKASIIDCCLSVPSLSTFSLSLLSSESRFSSEIPQRVLLIFLAVFFLSF
jgi:hypothetical protein